VLEPDFLRDALVCELIKYVDRKRPKKKSDSYLTKNIQLLLWI